MAHRDEVQDMIIIRGRLNSSIPFDLEKGPEKITSREVAVDLKLVAIVNPSP